jgi:hypothetical protein
MATKKRASGGKRAGDRKRAAAEAARARAGNYAETWAERYKALGPAPSDTTQAWDWMALVMMTAIEEAANDPGVTPESRREQLGRLVAQASKVIDPAQVTQRLDELERALADADDRH